MSTGTFLASPLRKAAVWMMALKIAVLTTVVDVQGLSPVDLPRVLGSRVLEWGLVATLVLLVLRHGLGIVPNARLHLAVGSVVVANLLSLGWAENRTIALLGEHLRYLGVLWLGDMVVLYLAACVALRTRRDVNILAVTLLCSTALSMVYALLQRAGVDPLHWTVVGDQPFGLFGNPNMCAQFLCALGAAALATAMLETHSTTVRGAAALTALLVVGMLGLTGARGAVLGLTGGGAALALIHLKLHACNRASWVRVATGVLLGCAALGLLVVTTPVGQRLAQLGNGLDDRVLIWEPVWREFLARPFLGWGPDSTGVGFGKFRPPGMYARLSVSPDVDQAHNGLLQAAVTTGTLGALAWVAFVAATVHTLWRQGLTRQPTVAAPLLAASAAYWTNALVTVQSVTVDWIPWLVAGSAVALLHVSHEEAPATQRLPWAVEVLVWLLALAGAAGGLGVFAANRAGRVAASALAAGDFSTASSAASAAIAQDPSRAEYWNYRGLARGRLGQLEPALQDFEAATRKAPQRAGYWGNLARVRADLVVGGVPVPGGKDAVYAAARKGIEWDPNNPTTHRTLAEVAQALGDPSLALRESVTAMRLHPADGSGDAVAARASERVAFDEARPLLAEALALRPDSAVLRAALGRLP